MSDPKRLINSDPGVVQLLSWVAIIKMGIYNQNTRNAWYNVKELYEQSGPSEQPRPWPRHFLAYQYFYLQKIH